VDALAVSLGFGLLAFSQVPTNRSLGLLVALGLASACFLTLAGTASLFQRLAGPRRTALRQAQAAEEVS
jgi:predicted RND superfamily exporter protein